ncbi:DUF4352 domain-containing protein [Glycomyces tritici]|uniref:DUF4352 domain-containing protein n=1 Tax=Glycomyces tritici TaxID=2665176 RepID=A0ABT7YJL0_9ACTN|nr:DUF4352 domain-containing protein [Glycomyces tritici]MDN3238785.1 DUF4352 domain-containing protein [Glycomyces tritici]
MTHPSPVDPQQPNEVPPPPSAGSEPPAPSQYSPPQQYTPTPFPPTAQPPVGGAARSKTIGLLSLIFGGAALLFGLIPVAGIFIGGLFGTAAIVLGIIGILKSHKIMSIIGIVLSVLGAILSFSITNSVADDLESTLEAEASESPRGEAESDAAASEEGGGEAAEPEAAGVGDTVADGDFEFTVGGFEQGVAEVGNEYLNEQAQGEFVIIDLTVKNIGSEAAYFSDSDQKLFDADGNEYSANSTAGIYLEDNEVWLTEINPGNQVEGKIVFDVPAGTELASLQLHDSMFSGGIEVSLK